MTVNIGEAKSTLSALVKRAESGEEILIARNGRAVARLTAISASAPRLKSQSRAALPWGVLKGKMLDNFDDPLEEMKDYM